MPVDTLELAQAAAITLTAAHAGKQSLPQFPMNSGSTSELDLLPCLSINLGLVSNSILVVNAFTHSPTIETVKIWRRVYLRGKPINLAVAATSCGLWSYLAYHSKQ